MKMLSVELFPLGRLVAVVLIVLFTECAFAVVPPTVAEGGTFEAIYRAPRFFEGPTWDSAGKRLLFTSFGKAESDTAILAWSAADGKTSTWADKTQGVNGTCLGPDGTLLGAQAFGHRLLEFVPGADGPASVRTWLVEPGLNQPNDVSMHQDGFVYFSDPDFKHRKKGAVYRFVKGGVREALPGELVLPNGVDISADGKLLVVSDSATKRWYAYDLKPGQPVSEIKPPRVFFDPPAEDSKAPGEGTPDGITLDEQGHFYLTGHGGIWCVNRAGKELGFLPLPEFVSNVCFGGPEGKWLFATCQDVVYRLRMKVGGVSVQPLNIWNNSAAPRNPLLTHHTYRSAAMKTDVGFTVWLPPQYARAPTRRFPVLYWLHGLGGSENGGRYPVEALAEGVAKGTLPPMILVQPNGGARSVYADSFDGRWLAETTIIRELIPHIDATFRTVANRDGRAIQGMSMGGEGAMRFAVKHPELFSSVVAYAGGFVSPAVLQQYRPRIYQEMFDGDPGRYDRFLTQTWIQENAGKVRGRVAIRIVCGAADESLNLSRQIHNLLTANQLDHDYLDVADAPHDVTPLVTRPGADDLTFAARHFHLPTP